MTVDERRATRVKNVTDVKSDLRVARVSCTFFTFATRTSPAPGSQGEIDSRVIDVKSMLTNQTQGSYPAFKLTPLPCAHFHCGYPPAVLTLPTLCLYSLRLPGFRFHPRYPVVGIPLELPGFHWSHAL